MPHARDGEWRAVTGQPDWTGSAWARKFFENWRAQLKWQRLKPYEKFAEMIDRVLVHPGPRVDSRRVLSEVLNDQADCA
jgi:hypothetical protein